MRKVFFLIILMTCLAMLTSCKMKSLVGKAFVFESFSFIGGENFKDIDPDKVKELENNYKTIVFSFEETTVNYHIFIGGETYDEVYIYTFIDGKLKIEDNSTVSYYIKNKKLYAEGNLDSFKVRLIFKQSK